ncbi:MAG TPA: hypothetical protein PKO12_11245 [Holophaga sp.]|nr:hypothetical protein [Holophaga sp.]
MPIVPVGIQGAFEVLPKGTYLLNPGRIRVAVGTPIPATEHPDREALMAAVRSQIEALLGEG